MTTIKRRVSGPLTVLSCVALLLVSHLLQPAEVKAQWTTPDASQNINNTNTGNVGIGTSSPSAKLEVNKNQNAGTMIVIDNGFTTSGNAAYSALLFKQAGANRLILGSINNNNSTQIGGAGAVQFWNFANGPTLFANNNTETMRLSAGGNLGIGTTSPGERLVTFGNMLAGNITSHTQLYSTYDSQSNVIMELGYGTATADIVPLPSLVLSKNLTSTNNGLGVISFANSNIANGSEKRLGAISSFTDGALNSGALLFYTTAAGTFAERMRITSGGTMGIGTATPNASYKLDVVGSINSSAGLCIAGVCKTDWSQVGGSQWTTSGSTINYASGNVGIGTTAPVQRLQIGTNTVISTGTPDALSLGGTYSSAAGVNPKLRLFDNNAGTVYGLGVSGAQFDFMTPAATRYVWSVNGVEKMRLDDVGNITIAGNINAKYQDVAEWVESSQELPAGTVVVLDSSKANQVVASTQSYDSRVAGVISLRPGLVLGEQGEGRVLVATTGRVKVKVEATNGPIKIGDLLVTSDKPGFAMKSLPVDIGGVRIHRPGTLIGKALEPLAGGTGEILVLLSLQ